jgi:dinuclear metal center YbgI/SA1388 family protein
MVDLATLVAYCDKLLEKDRFHDYGPNGLQLEGKTSVERLICGVTATQALIDEAIVQRADAILVHHGFFWKGENPCILGMKKKRLQALMQHDISLLAYHLPLDAHPVYGNNARLAKLLNISVEGTFGDSQPPIGMYGKFAEPLNSTALNTLISTRLNRTPQHIEGASETIHSIAWCSGAAQNYIEQAAQLGVDAFISGEISEQTVHVARELGIHYFAAGHHATETGGVMAMAEHLAEEFELESQFINIPNPV